MIKRGGGLGLVEEAGLGLLARQRMGGEELQRDTPLQLQVLGLVDHTHPALTELVSDAVVRNGAASHRAPSFGLSIVARMKSAV